MSTDQQQQTDRDHLADLIHEAVNAGGDDLTFDAAYSIAGCFVGSDWLKEHVAAARREALLEAARHFTRRANEASHSDLHMVSDAWDMAASDLRALAEPDQKEKA